MVTTRNPFIDPIEAPDLATKIVAKDGTDDAGYVTVEDVLAAGGLRLTDGATATGFSAANQVIFTDTTYTGSGLGPVAEISIADTAENLTVGSALVGWRVDHNVTAGAGAGSRSTIQSILNLNAATAGTNDGLKYYSSIFGQVYARANEGGTLGSELGNVYGVNGLAQAESGATDLKSIQGGEFNVSVQSGASAKFKSVMTLINVNSDAVQGTDYDAMLGFCRDGSAQFEYGICFGRPEANWPIDETSGTIIGTVAPASGSRAALNGIDFSSVTFTGHAWKSTGATIGPNGEIVSAEHVVSKGGSADWTGAGIALQHDGAAGYVVSLEPGVGWKPMVVLASTFTFLSGGVTQGLSQDASGNVGINETVPDYKLDVNGAIGFSPGASVTPVDNGDVVFQFTNNTTITVKGKGSDGTIRTATITLA